MHDTLKLSILPLIVIFAACTPSEEDFSTDGLPNATGGFSDGGGSGGASGGGPSVVNTGGAPTGGGSGVGGWNAGGTNEAGGTGGTGGTAGSGGALASGGADPSTGGTSTGGTGTGGNDTSTGGADTGETCPLPDTFHWTSTGPIAVPKEGWASLKDFTIVFHGSEYIVYMTNHDNGTSWGAAMFKFDDWAGAATATQQPMSRTSVAPTMFYFAPKDIWVLAYQWGSTSFSYATSNDPTDPSSWSGEQNLYNYTGSLPNSGTGPIDQHVICDDTDCYLFFNGDNGEIYRSSMPIDNFPGTFGPHETIMSRSTNELFEAVAVYSIKGSDEYLMLMESIGGNGRYFSAFTATDLGGEWTDLKTSENDPFAGRNNVTFNGDAWTNDISHGDLVRYNPDQTMEIDPCKLELLYQGRDPASGGDYGRLPYRPGVLTLDR
jgi:hypothetical protein